MKPSSLAAVALLMASAAAQDVWDLIAESLLNPQGTFVFVLQFALGFGLGYFSVKVLKHLLALMFIVVAGVILNVWQLGGIEGLKEFAARVGVEWPKFYITLKHTLMALGIMTALPMTLGFIAGLIVGLRK